MKKYLKGETIKVINFAPFGSDIKLVNGINEITLTQDIEDKYDLSRECKKHFPGAKGMWSIRK